MRWFRRPATSVPPKIDRSRLPLGLTMEEFVKVMNPGPVTALGRLAASIEPAPSQPQAGVKPPADDTDGKTWAWWEAQRSALIPGWAFCRFANRVGPEARFVYGRVRGSFGIWESPFEVCILQPERLQRTDILATVTHLLSGHAIGVFANIEVAVVACELADRVAEEWGLVKESERLDGAILRTRAAWDGVGIVPSTNAHAHDQDGDVLHIICRSLESITEGKPEKLS